MQRWTDFLSRDGHAAPAMTAGSQTNSQAWSCAAASAQMATARVVSNANGSHL
jgi:hypothetical protein